MHTHFKDPKPSYSRFDKIINNKTNEETAHVLVPFSPPKKNNKNSMIR